MGMASRNSSSDRPRRATNVSLDPRLIEEARALEVNIARACERGLLERIGEARAARWLAENGEAIAASNAYADQQALPLASLRLF
ncbi:MULTISPECIES: type II toxin-antitoxin system CcdA family antitoxin [unclassified Sphingomonas]|uniref:type II toxin-antitoxin system CcdA family antitoxin n=1 Tax=unclassified Sphingomonas TaxID=196159 RepID=UPI00226B5F5D|nr:MULTISPECIES: type II toxin-antitoxin system CcdA family antitoxin [unclassified Sphingomonas]